VFEDAAGWWYPQINVTEAGKDPLRVNTVEASGNFFSVVGVPPMLGAGSPHRTSMGASSSPSSVTGCGANGSTAIPRSSASRSR
jgi:hypothetical protein